MFPLLSYAAPISKGMLCAPASSIRTESLQLEPARIHCRKVELQIHFSNVEPWQCSPRSFASKHCRQIQNNVQPRQCSPSPRPFGKQTLRKYSKEIALLQAEDPRVATSALVGRRVSMWVHLIFTSPPLISCILFSSCPAARRRTHAAPPPRVTVRRRAPLPRTAARRRRSSTMHHRTPPSRAGVAVLLLCVGVD
jgi:hypothetical protein